MRLGDENNRATVTSFESHRFPRRKKARKAPPMLSVTSFALRILFGFRCSSSACCSFSLFVWFELHSFNKWNWRMRLCLSGCLEERNSRKKRAKIGSLTQKSCFKREFLSRSNSPLTFHHVASLNLLMDVDCNRQTVSFISATASSWVWKSYKQ